MCELAESVSLQGRLRGLGFRLVAVVVLSGSLASLAHAQDGVAPTVGSAAPDFKLKTLDARSVQLSDFRGKFVVLNFWATWCTPCQREIPIFVRLDKEYGHKGVAVVGIDQADPDTETVKKFVADQGIRYPILVGDDQIAHEYLGLQGVPVTFFIEPDGKIIRKISGGITSFSEVEEVLRPLILPSY
jgi:peroxiredoxin